MRLQNFLFILGAFSCLLQIPRPTHAFVASRRHPKPWSLAATLTPPPAVEIAQPQKVLQVYHQPRSVILDVRSVDEIVKDGFIKTNHAWGQVSCSVDDCPLLSVAAENIIHDKLAPVIVHCASGKRAARAIEVLEKQGYTNLVNAGSYKDLDYLQQEALKEQ